MYKKYRIILTIIGLLSVIGVTLSTGGNYLMMPTIEKDDYVTIVITLFIIMSLPLFFLTPILLLFSDIVYMLRKKTLSMSIKILDIIYFLILIIIIYGTTYGFKYELFVDVNEYIFTGIYMFLWILQIIFTFRWDKNLKK